MQRTRSTGWAFGPALRARLAALAAFVLILFAAGPAHAKDSDDPIVAGELGAEIEAAVDEAGGPGFWGAVLVSKGGEILLAKGYGFADFEKTPNTPRTLFELASVSKHVTAAAVLHLVQEGKVSLDDPITRFWKDVPEEKVGVTLHHLLTHTSGLTLDGVAYASPISRAKYVETILSRPMQSAPGEVYAYSNVGYALLAAIVEEVTRRPFEDYCEKHLFKPAKMKDTGFIGDRDLVRSKRVSTRGGRLPGTAAKWSWGWGYRGMGGVVTTVLDLHRWDRALRTDAVLDADTRALYYEPFLAGYACGWEIAVTPRGTRRASHTGSVSGYNTYLVRFVEDDACVAVLGNDGERVHTVTQAAEALLFSPPELEVDLTPARLDGRRVSLLSPEVRWDVSRRDGQLRLALVEGKERVAEIRAPAAFALGLAHRLETVAQASSTAGTGTDGAEPSTRGRIDLSPYDGRSKVELRGGTEIQIKPYPSNAERPLVFLLRDQEEDRLAIVIEMNRAAADELVAALRAE